MGWNVTLHPVSARELQRFLFDVLDTPALLEARLAELCSDPGIRQGMRTHFEATLRVVEEERLGIDRDDKEQLDDDRPCSAGHGTRWLGAAVASCLHPSWHSGRAALQRVNEIFHVVRPLAEIGTGRIREIDDYMGPHITGSSEASGFITPDGVREIRARMTARDAALLEQFGDEQMPEWESLRLAIDYAARGGLGLIEANDLTIGGWMLAPEPRALQTHVAKNSSAAPGQIRGPSLEWLALLGIMLIVVMLAPGTSTVDSVFALVLFAFLLMGMLAVRIAMRLFSSSANR